MYLVKTQKCLFYRFKKEQKRGRLLDVSNIKRGLGKTTLLVALAEKEGYVIVCKNMEWVNKLQFKYPNVKFVSALYIDKQCFYTKLLWHDCSEPKLLLEEGIDPKLIKN